MADGIIVLGLAGVLVWLSLLTGARQAGVEERRQRMFERPLAGKGGMGLGGHPSKAASEK